MTPARRLSHARDGCWPWRVGRGASSAVKKARQLPIHTITAASEAGHAVTMAFTGPGPSAWCHSGARPGTAVADALRHRGIVLTPPGY